METNVFVKFLPADITNDKLFSLFSPFGGIVSVKVMVNASSGASLGYGFVRFRENESAMRAISSMTGYKLGNKVLLCKLSDYFNFNDPCANLYIKPLPLEFREEQLREMFSKFGPIQTTKILRFEANSDSNIGFVRYENVESASQAIHELNGFIFAGHVHPLIVKYAESDSQRAMRKANTLSKPAQQPGLYNSGELAPPPQAYPPPQAAYNSMTGYEGNHVEQCGCAYCSGKDLTIHIFDRSFRGLLGVHFQFSHIFIFHAISLHLYLTADSQAPLWLPAQNYTVPAWPSVPGYYLQQSNEYGSDNAYQDSTNCISPR